MKTPTYLATMFRFFALFLGGASLVLIWVTLESYYIKRLSFEYLMKFSIPATLVLLFGMILTLMVLVGVRLWRLNRGQSAASNDSEAAKLDNDQLKLLLRLPNHLFWGTVAYGGVFIPVYHVVHYIVEGHSITHVDEYYRLNFLRSFLYEQTITLIAAIFHFAVARRLIRPMLMKLEYVEDGQRQFRSFLSMLTATFAGLLLVLQFSILWYIMVTIVKGEPFELSVLIGLVVLDLLFAAVIFILLSYQFRRELVILIRRITDWLSQEQEQARGQAQPQTVEQAEGTAGRQAVKQVAGQQADRQAVEQGAGQQASRQAVKQVAGQQADRQVVEQAEGTAGRQAVEQAAGQQASRQAVEQGAGQQASRQAVEQAAGQQALVQRANQARSSFLPILSNDEVGQLAMSFNHLQARVSREYEELEQELLLARQVQEQLMPQLDHFSGNDMIEVVREEEASQFSVSNVFYDIIPWQRGYVAVIGSSELLGMPAALHISAAQLLLRAELDVVGDQLDSLVLDELLVHYSQRLQDMFLHQDRASQISLFSQGDRISLAMAVVDEQQQLLRCATLGEHAAIWSEAARDISPSQLYWQHGQVVYLLANANSDRQPMKLRITHRSQGGIANG